MLKRYSFVEFIRTLKSNKSQSVPAVARLEGGRGGVAARYHLGHVRARHLQHGGVGDVFGHLLLYLFRFGQKLLHHLGGEQS